ncbi:uncharacterized protein [Hyperolius riggenbachi]|uniref:uncharacterized protein n=1 Tax=Hyperolius riggenbachi TaxID=752182 RepID=UPI0035A30A72
MSRTSSNWNFSTTSRGRSLLRGLANALWILTIQKEVGSICGRRALKRFNAVGLSSSEARDSGLVEPPFAPWEIGALIEEFEFDWKSFCDVYIAESEEILNACVNSVELWGLSRTEVSVGAERRFLTSDDKAETSGSSNRTSPERYTGPLNSQDSTQEHHTIPHPRQAEGVTNVKLEDGDEETHVKKGPQSAEESDMMGTSDSGMPLPDYGADDNGAHYIYQQETPLQKIYTADVTMRTNHHISPILRNLLIDPILLAHIPILFYLPSVGNVFV